MKNNQIWLIMHEPTGQIVFEYRTPSWNSKKAMFATRKYAEKVIKTCYLWGFNKNYDKSGFVAFAVGERLVIKED